MSVVLIDQQSVHYEVMGRGRPVLFLHGWLGSWRYWLSTMEPVAQYYRTYSFDFWGFGHSRRQSVTESITDYSGQVLRFLDTMGIERATLVGHSMGGMVAMKTALDHPERVSGVVTVGAPFDGSSLSTLLKLVDHPYIAHTFARWGWMRRVSFHFFLGQSNDPSVQEILTEAVKSNSDTLRSTVHSMMQTDLRAELPYLKTPALVVHGGRDDVVNPNQVNLFHDIPAADAVLMPTARHFPFYDQPDDFLALLLTFLEQRVVMSVKTTNGTPSPRNRAAFPSGSLSALGRQ